MADNLIFTPPDQLAGEDLSGFADPFFAIAGDDGKRAATALEAIGILQNKAYTGDALSLICSGVSRYFAGGTVAANKPLTVTASGTFEVSTSGDVICGKTIKACASGDIGWGIFDFAATARQSG